jgi:hypothetical protein
MMQYLLHNKPSGQVYFHFHLKMMESLFQLFACHSHMVSGDFYFHNFLSSIVKLTDLGLYILESIKSDRETMG